MLLTTRNTYYDNTGVSYLRDPDILNKQWKTRGREETNVILCDVEVPLSPELTIYLYYFGNKIANKIFHNLSQFSNLPIKEA